jgi:hypothetical protein
MRNYAYEVTLTRAEEKTLLWLRDRGYDAGFYHHSSSIIEDETDENITYKFYESDAWRVEDEYNEYPDAFLACSANETLNEKLLSFLESIV